jgi:CubicO group peptidase (beta-lactamase class C family)
MSVKSSQSKRHLGRGSLLGTTVAALLSSVEVSAGGLSPSAAARLDADIVAIAHTPRQELASVSVLVIHAGEIAYQYQTGMRRIDVQQPARSVPANSATLYRIASISKLVTTLGVMKLVEEGLLDLDADVSGYLGYALRNPHFPERVINLRMLLSHTSSLRDDAGYNFDASVALTDVLLPTGRLYGKGGMWAADHGPGFFTYVNLNWGVVGSIMERVTGERFDTLMQRLILRPMGLHGGYNAAEFSAADLQNLATLYRKRITRETQDIWQPDGPWIAQTDDYATQPPLVRAGPDYRIGSNGTLFGPHGSLRISAADLGQIMRMLMNEGRFQQQQILQPTSIQTMFAQQWRSNAQGSNGAAAPDEHGAFQAWGLGNQHFLNIAGAGQGDRLVEDGGFAGQGHFGDAWGLTSAFVLDFKNRNGIIFLAGGTAFDPETTPGIYSANYRYQERLLDALYRGVLKPAP